MISLKIPHFLHGHHGQNNSARTSDFSQGPLLQQIVFFVIPLFSSMLLQLTFQAADMIVVGRYASSQAMAAVGSTASLVHLFVIVLIGLSTGAAVVTSQSFGAKDYNRLGKVIHTSMLLAVVGGSLMGLIGIITAKPLLRLMDSPANIIDKSTLYMRICLFGAPFQMAYNFGSAIMRSLGDTKRPMFFLTTAGVVNVILNMVFVILFNMDVAGVAIATTVSQALSAFLVCLALSRNDEPYRLHLRRLRISKDEFKKILRIGIPSGIQGSFFTLSNAVIQSSVNSLGDIVMAGNAATQSLESLVYLGSYCFFHASLTFVGQNYGAKNYKRIKRSIFYSCILTVLICEAVGFVFYLFGTQLLSIYNPDKEVIKFGLQRMAILFTTYGFCGIMDVESGALRGLGYSVIPASAIFVSVCALRVAWCLTVFKSYGTLASIMYSYPISWTLASIFNGLFLWYIIKMHIRPKLKKPRVSAT
ncbi:MAG: MATE family efflux transporter [Victivallales bacterium]|nr:MATE family efflux transporter [Victivallales bacterium]